MMNIRHIVAAALLTIDLAACGGGGGGSAPPPTLHSVTLSWQANHETGVNSAGGGYKISISGQPTPIDVPYNIASSVTPTTTTISLYTGTYTATTRAYAALDTAGGATGNLSAPSAPITIVVP
jgi:hypothetical protein